MIEAKVEGPLTIKFTGEFIIMQFWFLNTWETHYDSV